MTHSPFKAPNKSPIKSLSVASYNIHKCVGGDGRFDPGRIAEVIAEIAPDIIALQEVDTRFGHRKGLLDLEAIAARTGLRPVRLSARDSAHGWHGNLILHRLGTVREVEQIALPGLEPRGALIAELEFPAQKHLRLVAAHFGLTRGARLKQAGHIAALIEERQDIPTLVLGDLNEWRFKRRSALSRLAPLFPPLPKPVASFPARLPVFALDRIVPDRDRLVAAITVHDTELARLASDHLPLVARVRLDGETIVRRLTGRPEEAITDDNP